MTDKTHSVFVFFTPDGSPIYYDTGKKDVIQNPFARKFKAPKKSRSTISLPHIPKDEIVVIYDGITKTKTK